MSVRKIVVTKEMAEGVALLAFKLGRDKLCLEMLELLKEAFSGERSYVLEQQVEAKKAPKLRLLQSGEIEGANEGELK